MVKFSLAKHGQPVSVFSSINLSGLSTSNPSLDTTQLLQFIHVLFVYVNLTVMVPITTRLSIIKFNIGNIRIHGYILIYLSSLWYQRFEILQEFCRCNPLIPKFHRRSKLLVFCSEAKVRDVNPITFLLVLTVSLSPQNVRYIIL